MLRLTARLSISAKIDIIESHSESQIHRRANRPMWYAAVQRKQTFIKCTFNNYIIGVGAQI